MPRNMQIDEKLWEKAKRAVAPHADQYDNPWPVVMTVYKNMLAARMQKNHEPKRFVNVSEGGPPFTLASFRRNNQDSPELEEWIRELDALKIGESARLEWFQFRRVKAKRSCSVAEKKTCPCAKCRKSRRL